MRPFGGMLWHRTPRALEALVLAGGLLSGVLLGSCGVSTDAAPRPLPRSQVPFHLLAPTGSTTSGPATGVQVTVYFIKGSQVQPVTRFVPTPVRVRNVLDSLISGPTSSELAFDGLSTDISTSYPPVRVLSATIGDGVATINFNQSIAGGNLLIGAVAQVVYTATAVPGVRGVRFEVGGMPTDVPTETSSQVPGPVTTANYQEYAPTTTTPLP